MKKYKRLFMNYVKEHCDEFKFKIKYDDYGTSYRFILPSPNKLFGIFPINFRFTIYAKPDYADKITIIDINTIFWNGIRLDRRTDIELIKFLSKIFVEKYKNYIQYKQKEKFNKLLNLTKEK